MCFLFEFYEDHLSIQPSFRSDAISRRGRQIPHADAHGANSEQALNRRPTRLRTIGCSGRRSELQRIEWVPMGRNMLIDGEWHTDVEPYTDDAGAFDRVETSFRSWIRDHPDARFRPEADRYHLYIARNCPWAHGVALTRELAGLTDFVSMDIVDPVRRDDGWQFTPDREDCTPDRIDDSDFLREVYVKADPAFTGRVTVPVLWDRHEETIVNNESIEIMRMFASELTQLGNGLDLYLPDQRSEIDGIIDELYEPLNNGVYRAGFASSQDAYDAAVDDVFDALDQWNGVLADQRYLAGDELSLADVRIFPTLIRFDAAYHTGFKCDKKFLHQYENLWPYLRDLYQTPGVAETVNMEHIRDDGYFQDEITPVGPALDFEEPHGRDALVTTDQSNLP